MAPSACLHCFLLKNSVLYFILFGFWTGRVAVEHSDSTFIKGSTPAEDMVPTLPALQTLH